MTAVIFRAPQASDEAQVAEAQRLMANEQFIFAFGYTPGGDFAQWLNRLSECQRGKNLDPGQVPATFELAIVDGRITERLSVRHVLNDNLLQKGGHIGYGVLPQFRRRGIGSQLLQRGLRIASTLGIPRALVTCDEDNVASHRIIENAGGLYESSYRDNDGHAPTRRYWIG